MTARLPSRPALLLVALKYAPVHKLHMLAYRDAFLRCSPDASVAWLVADEYHHDLPAGDTVVTTGVGRSYAHIVGGALRQLRHLPRLVTACAASDGSQLPAHVLVQAPHPLNSWFMRAIRTALPDASIRYYLHEPTSLPGKIRKREPPLAAAATYCAQFADVCSADIVYVGHQRALTQATSAFPLTRMKVRGRVLPLPFRDMFPPLPTKHERVVGSHTILFLGRADARRCPDLFFAAAEEAWRRGRSWAFVMLTASELNVPASVAVLPNVRIVKGAPYSDEQMIAELLQATYVFNYYRVAYTQSGVTPVALMFGVPVIAHAQERDPGLAAAGCMYFDREPTPADLVNHLERAPAPNPAHLREAYLDTHDASRLRIPA
jgi:hypothetical protein